MQDADKNRRAWNAKADDYQRRHRRDLRPDAAGWGVWRIPDAQVGALGDVRGLDVLELGCGGGHWAVWLANHGARVSALDLSERQIRHARALAAEHGVPVRLVQSDAATLPFTYEAFDVVFSDHGGTTFADPERYVADAARVLRPGGRFAFCHTTPVLELCWNATTGRESHRLERDYFTLGRLEWDDEVTYQLTYGEWIRTFRRNGFDVEDLVELRPPEGATTTFGRYVSYRWARRWPAEHVWVLKRR